MANGRRRGSGTSLVAATEPEVFDREVEELLARSDAAHFIDEAAAEGAVRPVPELLAHWRTGRAELLTALAAQPPGARLPWYGPPMSAPAMTAARIMETWAHGTDVADALGVRRAPTARLRHVVRIGVRARDHAYAVHGLTPPAEPFRVELDAPDGELWAHGPQDAAQRVTGAALDFCLLVTQRLHRDDARLHARGPEAERWLGIAQAFAGPPGPGRARVGEGEA
ncbi:TIGR03084 family metal-binding protein [Streptomyces axinellae]|uniref:TIGR03084 family protein n=1 Tax=Streptomyces axinellae TaxID=552788 RepID=A0ABN3QBT2_9ACTN